jgi:hypothetical protein
MQMLSGCPFARVFLIINFSKGLREMPMAAPKNKTCRACGARGTFRL